MIKQKSISNNRPIEGVDNTSSPTTVYVRENIIEKELLDDFTNETYTIYEYDEIQYTTEEYRQVEQDNAIIENTLLLLYIYEMNMSNVVVYTISSMDERIARKYAEMIKKGYKTIDEVPIHLRELVEDKLNE